MAIGGGTRIEHPFSILLEEFPHEEVVREGVYAMFVLASLVAAAAAGYSGTSLTRRFARRAGATARGPAGGMVKQAKPAMTTHWRSQLIASADRLE
jgi:hypothetical protein